MIESCGEVSKERSEADEISYISIMNTHVIINQRSISKLQ